MVGRLGSGCLVTTPPLVDDFPALNIHQLARAGVLVSGAVTPWQLHQRDGKTITATIYGKIGHVVIELDGAEIVVQVDQCDATFGGNFALFVCPRCRARRWDLYLADHIGCRGCLGLEYQSRHTRWNGRAAIARAARLHKRLNDGRRIAADRRRRILAVLARCEAKAQVAIAATQAAVERASSAANHPDISKS
jgi:hypothetical protein